MSDIGSVSGKLQKFRTGPLYINTFSQSVEQEESLEADQQTSPAALVQDAFTVREVLEAAELLPAPGSKNLHWQKQTHHKKKRLKTAVSALRKLPKMPIGAAGESRDEILRHPSLAKYMYHRGMHCGKQ